MSRYLSRRGVLVALAIPIIGATAVPGPAGVAASGHHVLRVGSFHGVPGQFASIQAAVNAAQAGDWILVAPGDYHETGAPEAGVLVTTPGIHIRGMNRNSTVVDGTLAGSAQCDSTPAAQNPGAVGRNGVEVLKVDGVSVENLTVCNFLSGSSGDGNQVWFNGGDGSGIIGMGPYRGAYLTASSTYFQPGTSSLGMYGIFVSNSRGSGLITNAYASNMADSGFYVGACPDCNATLRFVHSENNALGYSGTNAGGHLIIEYSEWNQNRTGMAPNSLNNSDAPSPQNGACPSPSTQSCTVIRYNFVHDNNNPNTPAVGLTASTPIGTGIELSGGQNDIVQSNIVYHQGSWGILVHDYPDAETPPPVANCNGGIPNFPTSATPCYFIALGNHITRNGLFGNGFFANPTNTDLADASLDPALLHYPGTDNCFNSNVDWRTGTPSSDPASIQSSSVLGTCKTTGHSGDMGQLITQIICAAFGVGCPPGSVYPQTTVVQATPIPQQPSMPHPCDGVPANPWCAG